MTPKLKKLLDSLDEPDNRYAGWGHPAGEPPKARPLTHEECELINRIGYDEAIEIINAESAEPAIQPIMVSLADVEPKTVEWLWPGRIAIGKLTLIAGDPGLGKSFLSIDLTGRVTNGTRWPDCDDHAPQGTVILLSAEDDLGDTIRPRLDAAGADVSKVIAIQGIHGRDDGGEYERMVDLQRDLSVIEQAIDLHPDTKLVVIDPISAYLGKTDSHRDSEVRALLAPLSELAARRGVAIVGIAHLRKGEGAAIYRAMGSLAFVAAARAVWAVARDKADEKRRLFLPVKNNLGTDQSGLAFTLSLRYSEAKQPCVVWEAEPVTTSADEALEHHQRRGHVAGDEAVEFLREALAGGARLSREIEEEAREVHCIAKRTLERAKKSIGVIAYRDTVPGPWLVRLPERQQCQDFPD